jgi:hypothetical protein
VQLKPIAGLTAFVAAVLTLSTALFYCEAAAPGSVCTPAAPSLAQQVCAPYVAIVGPDAEVYGAGTVLRVRGELHILTAAHVVCGPKDLAPEIGEIRHYSTEADPDEPREARVVAYSAPEDAAGPKGDDLALLKPINPAGLSPARIAPKPFRLERGEDMWYIGSPAGEIAHLERSIYSRDRTWAGKTFYITNGCAYFGNSGGGCYVKRGDTYFLVGVLTRRLKTEWPTSPPWSKPRTPYPAS